MLSTRASCLAILHYSLSFAVQDSTARAADGGWPEGYELAEKSESPNGRYGVLLPSRTAADGMDDDKITNKLVDLKTHGRLCVIRGANYFPGQNHHGLTVKWGADSSWCAVIYEARYGFGNITLVEPEGANCTQTDLGKHIQKALDSAIAQQAHDPKAGGYGSAFFRPGPAHTVLVRATAYTNPKAFADQPTYNARFEGTFDLATHKWTRSSAARTDSWDALNSAYGDELDPTAEAEEERLKWYDDRLNEAYTAVRAVLPAERFASVKKQQIAWLKLLEAQGSATAKGKFMRARIKELTDLLW